MPTINSIPNSAAIQQPQVISKQIRSGAPKQVRVTDRLELSGVSHLLDALKTNDVRVDKVASIRAQIEAGTYEDDKKLDVALDRLLDELIG